MSIFDSLTRKRRISGLCGVALASALTAGCSAVGSLPVDFQASGAEPINGWSYSLPKGVFQVALYDVSVLNNEIPFRIKIEAEGPYFVADPVHTYRLDFAESSSHSEALSVSYYRDTTFLRQIRFRSSSAVDEALVAAATDARRIAIATGNEAGEVIEGLISGPFTVDLLSAADRARTERVLTAAIQGYAEAVVDDCLRRDIASGAATRDSRRCDAALDLLVETERSDAFVHLSVEVLGSLRGGQGDAAPLDDAPVIDRAQIRSCSEGVCYRPFVPYIVTLTIGKSPDAVIGQSRVQFTVALPNGAAPLAMPLDRPLLAERGGAIIFDYPGVPAAMLTYRESDTAEAIVLPFEVAGAAVGATVSGLQTDQRSSEALESVKDTDAGKLPSLAGLSESEAAAVRERTQPGIPDQDDDDRRPIRELCGEVEGGDGAVSPAAVPATFIGTCTRGEAYYPYYLPGSSSTPVDGDAATPTPNEQDDQTPNDETPTDGDPAGDDGQDPIETPVGAGQ